MALNNDCNNIIPIVKGTECSQLSAYAKGTECSQLSAYAKGTECSQLPTTDLSYTFNFNIYSSILYLWPALGLYRGIIRYKNYCIKYNKTHYYIDGIFNGIMFAFAYNCPILLPFMIRKEIIRFEINVRNLKNEYNSYYYDEIF